MSLEVLAFLPGSRLDAEFRPVRSFEVFRDGTLASSQAALTTRTFDRNGVNKENIPPPMMGIYGLQEKKSSLCMALDQKTIKKRVTSRKFSNGSSLNMVESQERKARELNQKAKELTQLPLADISVAY